MKNSIIIFVLVLLFNCNQSNPEKSSDTKVYPDIVENNYEHYIYKNTKKYLYTKIKVASIYEKLEKIECMKINGEIYKSTGELTTKITADDAVINQKEKKAVFSGHVIFDMIDTKAKLHADEIILDYQNNKLYCRNDVIIEKDDGSYLKATSLETNIKTVETKFTKMDIKYYYDEEKEKEKDNKKQ